MKTPDDEILSELSVNQATAEKVPEETLQEKVDLSTDNTIAVLEAKLKALEEAVLRSNKPYTKAAEGATVCPDCGSFTDWLMNPLTYGCKNCGASFHPQKPTG